MPKTIEPNEYDLFDFKQPEEKPLSLAEAIEEAAKRRSAGNRGCIYRIAEAGHGRRRFRVIEVPTEKAEEELLARMSSRWARLVSHYRLIASR